MGGGAQSENGGMEGWLYLFTYNRLGYQVSRKRYFILKENLLSSFKNQPLNVVKEPNRSAIIDSSVRVNDNGRESINKKVFFIFTVYNASNQRDKLKLGASSSEEAAKWIRSLQDAAMKEPPNLLASPLPKKSSLRKGGSKRPDWVKFSFDWQSWIYSEAMTSDVIDHSPWQIFGCYNGLRMFKEANPRRGWGDIPVMMGVGVVDASSEAIFHTLMSLGPSRSEWDFCVYQGNVVDHIDGHSDIIHLQMYNDFLPWGIKPRDMLLRRYWRREDDGTYVILLHSVHHKKCPQNSNFVRASLKSGGYVVTPVNKGKQSVVKHMLAIDWKLWKLYLRPTASRSLTIRMLERIAALREMFKSKGEGESVENIAADIGIPATPANEKEDNEVKTGDNSSKKVVDLMEVEDDAPKEGTRRTSLVGLHESADEFFDVPEPVDQDHLDNDWQFDNQTCVQSPFHPKLPTPAGLVKKLQGLAVQKKGYMEIPEVALETDEPAYGTTLQKDLTCDSPCSWAESDPSLYLIRGPTYLTDNQKVKAIGSLMQLVGVDWLRSGVREDNLSSRPNSIVQKYAAAGGSEFFFVINIQLPGNPLYSAALYYMMRTPLEDNYLLHNFVEGDDAYRNSRFKLIPYISKGSWVVKQSVGKKACLLGQALEVKYIRGKNYLELDINVGSSTVARGVVNLVLGYLNNLVIEMAFLIQGNTQEELPEILIGTCRLNHLDSSKAFMVKQ
ncbi:protein ENHANCED DISEASE RESISTANCE 2-like [Arachis duranensis]|uniref:Protein ENHANCED DISEASE RESISTANCE 2-like n=1 Tax=Arachis duranensis TaxID=130453 RepID=A0A9C6TWE9_ARADU|nr:protein ENHANCED DISEASE RESISTANCE 2-like [Arachis duranensis]